MDYTPISKNEARGMAIGTAIQLIFVYSISFIIWGLAFKNLLTFFIIGMVLGAIVSVISVRVTAYQVSKERANDMTFATTSLWGGIGIIIGITGLIVWLGKIIFFT